jgi:hypothetical protein
MVVGVFQIGDECNKRTFKLSGHFAAQGEEQEGKVGREKYGQTRDRTRDYPNSRRAYYHVEESPTPTGNFNSTIRLQKYRVDGMERKRESRAGKGSRCWCWLLVVDTRHVHDVTTLFRRLSRAYFFVCIFLYIRAQRGRQRSSRFFALTLAVLAFTVGDVKDQRIERVIFVRTKDRKTQFKQ